MAGGEINMKQISEDLKIFLTKQMENNAKKITEKIIEKMDTKFDKLSTRIETIDRKAEAAETLAKQNQNNISHLTSQSTALQEKLVQQAKKIRELEENIEDPVNRNPRDTQALRDIKKENQEKTWNNTSHVHSSSLCGLFGWNPNQFLSDIERAHRGDYKNPNSPIYMKFISWKVSQAVLDSIIRANRSRQTNISASQKYSDKVQKRMNRLLITRREFRSDEEKSSWKSYVKYPGVLMVKKLEDRNYSVYMVATD